MKFQTVFELLLVFTLIAFAAARVIDGNGPQQVNKPANILKVANRQDEIVVGEEDETVEAPAEVIEAIGEEAVSNDNEVNNVVEQAEQEVAEAGDPVNVDDAHPINRYCNCNEVECNCCRDFKLPIVPVRGPGCATVRYVGKNKMSVSIKYGDITLASRTVSGTRARPICMPLPGGYSRFCGRVYGITREKNDFKACLGLELRAEDEVEAALRVSCFKFGAKGLQLADPEPLPPLENEEEDDDDDDILGFGAGDDDDDDDDDDDSGDDDGDVFGFSDADDEEEEADDDDSEDDDTAEDDSGDYTGFSLLTGDFLEDIFGSDSNKKKKPVGDAAAVPTTTVNRNKNTIDAVASTSDKKPSKTKVKLTNTQTILNSASADQNEVDSAIQEDEQVNSVDVKPEQVEEGEVVGSAKPLEVTTQKTKKKNESFLDVVQSLVADDDDDDEDDDDDDEEEKDEADDDKEDDEDEKDDEKEDDADDDKEDEEIEEEIESDDDEDDDEDEENDDDDDSKVTTEENADDSNKNTKKNKKKTSFGLGLLGLGRLVKLFKK